MKRKIVTLSLAACAAACLCFGLAACGGGDENARTEHTHTYSEKWTVNEDCHWHSATCEHTDEVSEKSEHTYVNGVCAVCGYEKQHKHTFSDSWTSDEFYHWYSATCEHTDEVSEKSEHTYVNGVCVVCGYEQSTSVSNDGLEFTINSDNSSYSVTGFYGDGNVVIPSEYNKLPVTSIDSYAFGYCSGLTGITIPDSVASIGDRAFSECSGLTNITIPDSVTSIGESAFYGCNNLEAVNISDIAAWCGITFIGTLSNPLSYANNLYLNGSLVTNLVIPDGVTSIGSYAFYECSGLTSITIPDGVTSIGESAFYNCSGLTIYCETENQPDDWSSSWNYSSCPVVWNCKNNNTASNGYVYEYIDGLRYQLKDGVATVYKQPTTLTGAVVIPSTLTDNGTTYNVTSIGNDAFYFCRKLTSVTIGDGVTSIGESAFEGCSGLTNISIPDSVKSIGKRAFISCKKLIEVYNLSTLPISKGSEDYGFVAYYAKDLYTSISAKSKLTTTNDGYIFYDDTANGNGCYLMGYTGTETSLTLPDNFNNKGYGIYQCAFSNYTSLTSITIPDSVTSIGEDAFYECSRLTSITIPNSVTSIGESAFYGCNNLEAVYISDIAAWCGITFIGNPLSHANNLYLNGSLVTNLVIPDGVTSISNDAFDGCSGLTSITIPDSVASIGYRAFYNCSGLTNITIPDSVTSIGNEAFYGCFSLNYNEYDNAYYLGNKLNPYVVLVKAKGTSITSCSINTNTKVIYYSAFKDCSSLTSITIPNSVTSIGGCAFLRCSSLANITIPDSVTSISDSAFYNCSGLISVTIGNGVTSISDSAFGGCSGLTSITIPDSVTSIGNEAFYNCSGLTSVTIPDSVTSIGYSAFSGCSGLTSITIPDGVTSIGYSAFSGCSSLTSITIPDGVTSIGSGAFYRCSNLKSITLPFVGVSKDGTENKYFGYIFGARSSTDNSSYVPESLKTVTITGGSSIGYRAFYNCSGLTSITIPDTVTSIGSSAFSGCSGLTGITIPDGVTSIGSGAFYGMAYYNDESNWDNGVLYIGKYLIKAETSLSGTHAIKEGTLTIASDAFKYCSSLTSITIPDSVTSIGESAFYYCSGLTSITILGRVTSIGSYAFYNCSGLTNITISGELTDILQYIPNIKEIKEITILYDEDSSVVEIDFSTMSALETINLEYFEDEVKIYNVRTNVQINYGYNCQVGTSDGFGYAIRGNVASLTSYTGNAERIILPAQIEGVAITKLGSIFKNNTTVKEIVIPEGYTEIADEAFYGCTALEIVYIPSTITKMGENVFYNNNMAYNAPSNLPFANDGSYILSGIYTSLSLTTGNWTDKAYFIHKNSHFDADSKIIYEYGGGIEEPRILRYSGTDSTVTVPATIENIAVKEIYYCAFYGIQTLNSVTLSEGIESIGKSAFEGCSALQNVSLPQSLTTIAAGAFKDCSNLTTITIPRAVKMIGDHVFTGCSALASISFELPTGWISYTFTDTGANPDSAQSHDMSNATECVTILRDTYAERMFVNGSAVNNTSVSA